MADDSLPLQPVLASSPNMATPEAVREGTGAAAGTEVGSAFMGTAGAQVIERGVAAGYAALHGGDQTVPYDKAVGLLKAGNYDSSGVPKEGWSESALTVEMQRQERAQDASLAASRANLSNTTQFVANVVGGLGDPITLAAGPVLGKVTGAIEAPLAGRAAMGAAEGAGIVGGEEALQNSLQGHDEDTLSWTTLRDITLSAAPGALLHGAFGARPAPRVGMTDTGSFAKAVNFTMGQEGGLANDTGGLTKFGISQKAHPGLDITKLTPADAGAIYHNEYWKAIGGDDIKDPALAAAAFDAAVNQGVSNAKKWITESGGDVEKLLALREADYRRLAAENPAKYGKYLNGWLTRLTSFRVQMMGQIPKLGETTGALEGLPHTGPLTGPHSDVETQALDAEYMRRYGGATSPVPYSDEQQAVLRVMGGPSEYIAPAFSREFLERHGGDTEMVLPKIQQRGPASPVGPGYNDVLQRFAQRMGADWEDRSNAARLAVAQLSNDSPVDVKPVGEKPGLSPASAHDAEVQQLHTSAMLDAIPKQDSMISKGYEPAVEQTVAPKENAELEHYQNATASAHERVAGLGPEATEAFKNELAEQERTPEVGTLQHEEVTKGVQAAVQCGVMKGVDYGVNS